MSGLSGRIFSGIRRGVRGSGGLGLGSPAVGVFPALCAFQEARPGGRASFAGARLPCLIRLISLRLRRDTVQAAQEGLQCLRGQHGAAVLQLLAGGEGTEPWQEFPGDPQIQELLISDPGKGIGGAFFRCARLLLPGRLPGRGHGILRREGLVDLQGAGAGIDPAGVAPGPGLGLLSGINPHEQAGGLLPGAAQDGGVAAFEIHSPESFPAGIREQLSGDPPGAPGKGLEVPQKVQGQAEDLLGHAAAGVIEVPAHGQPVEFRLHYSLSSSRSRSV